MNKFLKQLSDWEERFYEWLEEHRDETTLVSCVEYANQYGNLDGWVEQVRANDKERARMKRRYCEEIEKSILGNGVGVVEFIG